MIKKVNASFTTDNIKIVLVVPLYNNAGTIRTVAEEALKTGYELLVVNDGSTDGSPEKIKGLSLALVEHAENMGKGVAIQTAAEWAENHGYTHIITIDADGQHDPSEVSLFVEKVRENPLSIVVGNRDFSGEEVPLMSRFGRKNSNFWLKISSGSSLPDTQSGFRAYPVEAVRKIKCVASRYNYEIEILVRGAWAGLSLDYVNIKVKYSDETKKASHFDPLIDNLRCSMTFARLVFRNFLPVPHKILFGSSHGEKVKYFFANPWASIKILLKERTSLNEIALAVMLGVFLGVLPFIACHSVVIVFCATRLKLNRLIALNVSHICAPPFVPAICIEVGYFVRNGRFLTDLNWHTLGYQIFDRFIDYLIGTLVFAPILAILCGVVVYIAGLIIIMMKRFSNAGKH